MEDKKEAGGETGAEKKGKNGTKKKDQKTIKLYCPSHVGDPKLDQLVSNFSAKLSHMTYSEMANLLLFKNIKNIHEEAFAEAQKMTVLQHGNYFAITGFLFTINYRTEVTFFKKPRDKATTNSLGWLWLCWGHVKNSENGNLLNRISFLLAKTITNKNRIGIN